MSKLGKVAQYKVAPKITSFSKDAENHTMPGKETTKVRYYPRSHPYYEI
jgi:hypothetical protein